MDSTFKPTLLLISGRIMAFAATFFVPVILVRIFDPTEFGTYKQLFLIYSTLYGIAQLGMAESLYYFLPLAPQKGGRYIMNSLIVLIAAGLVSMGILQMNGSMISDWMGNHELARYIPWMGVYLLLTVVTTGLEISMVADNRYLRASVSYAISDLLRASFFIIPVLFVGQLKWLLMGGVVFASVRFGVTIFYFRRKFKSEFKPDSALLKKQLAYALPFEMAAVVYILQSNFHQYAVSYRFDAATFAIYSIGCLQIPLVDLFFTATSSVMMVRMGEKIRDGRVESVLAIWHDATRKLALIFFPLVALLLLTANTLIVTLFTESYAASVPIFMVSSVAIVLATLMTDAFLRVFAETRFLLVLYMIRLGVILVLIYPFMSAFSLVGALLVNIVADFIAKAIALVKMKKLLKVTFMQLLPWGDLSRIFIMSAVATLPALGILWKLEISGLPLLLTLGSAYTITYVAMLFGLGLLRDDEKLEITNTLHKFLGGALRCERLKGVRGN
jgi:O-antigen/teichoic acid export membrane protein